MSKEFQIRNGNLIASFDLENEDGDIDFCKLLKVSHGVADEIGMFVDYVAINKIIKDQSKQISDLETELADAEEHIDNLELQLREQYQLVDEKDEEIALLEKALELACEKICENGKGIISWEIDGFKNKAKGMMKSE